MQPVLTAKQERSDQARSDQAKANTIFTFIVNHSVYNNDDDYYISFILNIVTANPVCVCHWLRVTHF